MEKGVPIAANAIPRVLPPNMAAAFMCPSTIIYAYIRASPATIQLLPAYTTAVPVWSVLSALRKIPWAFPTEKTSNVLTTKADLFLAGIVQLLCVLLAHKLHDVSIARSPRKLIA